MDDAQVRAIIVAILLGDRPMSAVPVAIAQAHDILSQARQHDRRYRLAHEGEDT